MNVSILLFRVKSFLKFYLNARTEYNIQSPFLYEFVQHILDTKKEYYAFRWIENHRKGFLKSPLSVPDVDFGAGQNKRKYKNIKVRDIAKKALSSPSQCRIIFNIINHFRCQNILELGTSLGMSSSYMAAASISGNITTCEGNPHIADMAKNVHQQMGFHQVRVLTGPFEKTLEPLLKSTTVLDFVYIDGHHKEKPTLDYFEQILRKCHNDSIIVLDDIYWSPEMTSAWNLMCQHPKVTLSIDLYDMGVLFLKKELSKQHVSFLTYKYKPWKIGLMG